MSLKTGLNTEIRGSSAKSQGRWYYCNDFDRMQVVERGDWNAADAGIAAPGSISAAAASGSNGTAGTKLVRYRYKNSRSGYYSDPSNAVSVTTSGTQAVQVTFATSADAKVDSIVIEQTSVTDNGTYYIAAVVANTGTTATPDVSDVTLTNSSAVGTLLGDFGHQQPPLFSLVCEHRGRLFGWFGTVRTRTVGVTNNSATVTGTNFSAQWAGRLFTVQGDTQGYFVLSATTTQLTLLQVYAGSTNASVTATIAATAPDMLYWSRSGLPEEWKPTDWARRVLQNQADVPSGMASFFGDLYLFGQHTQRRLIYNFDPSTAQLIQIPTELGLWNQRCLVQAEGRLWGFGRAGAWVINGLLPKHISGDVDVTLAGLLDASQYDKFHGVYDPRERVISWFYVAQGDSQPKRAISYEIETNRWQVRTYTYGIETSAQLSFTNQPVTVAVGDENSFGWKLLPSTFDGVPTALTSGIVTVATATTTVINTNETLTASNTLKGCTVYRVATAEYRYCTANTTSQITVNSAWTSMPTTPAASEAFYLGAIAWQLSTKWWTAGTMRGKKRTAYLVLELTALGSSAAGKIKVQLFSDFSTTPLVLTGLIAEVSPDGVVLDPSDATNSTALVDADAGSGDGYVAVPVTSDWTRSLRATLTSLTPVGTMRILDVYFTLDSPKRDTKRDQGE